jgi:aspartyl-tRNA synthetase
MVKDDDYVMSMEYGMPPISGWGIGIDRLVQFVTNSENIKDCVLFPLTRKAQGSNAGADADQVGDDQDDYQPKI